MNHISPCLPTFLKVWIGIMCSLIITSIFLGCISWVESRKSLQPRQQPTCFSYFIFLLRVNAANRKIIFS